jgi:hypothetical protein
MEYKRFEIDLSVVRTDELFDLGGTWTSFMIVKKDANFQYRINSLAADTLYSDELPGLEGEGVFRKLFLTHSAGTTGHKAVLVVYR